MLLLLVLPAGAGHAKSHKSRGRSVGAAHSYVYKSKKASKSYRASNSGSRSGRKTKVSYRPKARVTRHKSAPKRKSHPRKSSPKRTRAATPRKTTPKGSKAKHPSRHATHKAKPKHKATTRHKTTPKHKNKKASKSKAKSSKKHSTPKKKVKSKARSKKKQSFLGKLWTSAKKKVKTAVHKGQKFVKKVKMAVHKVAKKVRKVVHHAVKAVSKAAKTVKKFVQKHSTAIFTGLSVAAVVLSFTPLAPLGIAMDAGLTAWSAYNAISGKDLLSGAHLSNGARIGYGAGVLLSVAGPLVGKIAGKGLNKLAETPQVSKMLGKLSNGTELLKASKTGQLASKLSGTLKNLGSKVSESVAGKALNKASTTMMKPLNKANDAYEGAAEKIKELFSKNSTSNKGQTIESLGKDEARKAVQKHLENGRIDVKSLKKEVPKGIPNTFKPTNRIPSGEKYEFNLSDGQKAILKWHAPDSEVAKKFPNSPSGKEPTAQLKVGNKLLKNDGTWTRNQSSPDVHIPLKGK